MNRRGFFAAVASLVMAPRVLRLAPGQTYTTPRFKLPQPGTHEYRFRSYGSLQCSAPGYNMTIRLD